MTDEPDAEDRLRELEAENARLRELVDAPKPKRAPHRLRRFAATVCVVVAAVLVPVAVLVSWAQSQLLDEQRFLATFAPLAEHPAIQAEIVEQTMGIIDDRIDIEDLTGKVFDGIVDLGLSETAASVLNLLRQPAAEGVRTMIDRGVTAVVGSDAFAATWDQALRLSHRAFVAAVSGESAGQAVTIDADGQIAVQLGPIVQTVQAELEQRGFGLASAIPAIDAAIPIATTDAVPTLRLIVTLTALVGWWLPVVIAGLLLAGIALAPRRARAVAGAGIGLAAVAVAVLILFEATAIALHQQAPALGVGAEALAVLFAQLVAEMRTQAVLILVLGIALWIAGWVIGASDSAAATRRWVGTAATAIGARVTRVRQAASTESAPAPATIGADDSRTDHT